MGGRVWGGGERGGGGVGGRGGGGRRTEDKGRMVGEMELTETRCYLDRYGLLFNLRAGEAL